MKNFARHAALAALLAAAVPMSATAFAATYSDTASHWAADEIEKWSTMGILSGYEGTFRPNESITRGEMAVVLNKVMNYQKAAVNAFADLGTGFYTDAVLKANQAGVLSGDDRGVRPTDAITRQEAASMMARALGLDNADTSSVAFADEAEIADWAKGSVHAMANRGWLVGSDGKFNPSANITRAETVQILDSAVKALYNKAGSYTKDINGDVIVNAADAVLKDMSISGDLILSEGVAEGDATLDNVQVAGNLIVRGGGVASVHLKNGSQVGKLIAAKSDGALRVAVGAGITLNATEVRKGLDKFILNGTVKSLTVNTADVAVSLENASAEVLTLAVPQSNVSIDEKSSVTAVDVALEALSSVLNIKGTVGDLSVDGPSANIAINGKVDTVTMSETAAGSTLDAQLNAEIKTINVAAPNSNIKGDSEKVGAVNVKGNGISVNVDANKVNVSDGVTGTTVNGSTVDAGKSVSGGTSSDVTYSSSEGSSGKYSDGGSADSTTKKAGINSITPEFTYDETTRADEENDWANMGLVADTTKLTTVLQSLVANPSPIADIDFDDVVDGAIKVTVTPIGADGAEGTDIPDCSAKVNPITGQIKVFFGVDEAATIVTDSPKYKVTIKVKGASADEGYKYEKTATINVVSKQAAIDQAKKDIENVTNKLNQSITEKDIQLPLEAKNYTITWSGDGLDADKKNLIAKRPDNGKNTICTLNYEATITLPENVEINEKVTGTITIEIKAYSTEQTAARNKAVADLVKIAKGDSDVLASGAKGIAGVAEYLENAQNRVNLMLDDSKYVALPSGTQDGSARYAVAVEVQGKAQGITLTNGVGTNTDAEMIQKAFKEASENQLADTELTAFVNTYKGIFALANANDEKQKANVEALGADRLAELDAFVKDYRLKVKPTTDFEVSALVAEPPHKEADVIAKIKVLGISDITTGLGDFVEKYINVQRILLKGEAIATSYWGKYEKTIAIKEENALSNEKDITDRINEYMSIDEKWEEETRPKLKVDGTLSEVITEAEEEAYIYNAAYLWLVEKNAGVDLLDEEKNTKLIILAKALLAQISAAEVEKVKDYIETNKTFYVMPSSDAAQKITPEQAREDIIAFLEKKFDNIELVPLESETNKIPDENSTAFDITKFEVKKVGVKVDYEENKPTAKLTLLSYAPGAADPITVYIKAASFDDLAKTVWKEGTIKVDTANGTYFKEDVDASLAAEESKKVDFKDGKIIVTVPKLTDNDYYIQEHSNIDGIKGYTLTVGSEGDSKGHIGTFAKADGSEAGGYVDVGKALLALKVPMGEGNVITSTPFKVKDAGPNNWGEFLMFNVFKLNSGSLIADRNVNDWAVDNERNTQTIVLEDKNYTYTYNFESTIVNADDGVKITITLPTAPTISPIIK